MPTPIDIDAYNAAVARGQAYSGAPAPAPVPDPNMSAAPPGAFDPPAAPARSVNPGLLGGGDANPTQTLEKNGPAHPSPAPPVIDVAAYMAAQARDEAQKTSDAAPPTPAQAAYLEAMRNLRQPAGGGGAPGASAKALEAEKAKALALAAEAGGAETDAEKAKAAAMASEGDRLILEQHDQADKAAARGKQADEHIAKATQFADDAAAMKIDPDRYWSEKGKGTKILASFFAALSGPEGVARMQHAVDRDLEIQKEDYARKRNRLGDEQSIYGQLRQSGLDAEQADAGYRASVAKYFQHTLGTIEAQNAGPKLAAKIDQAKFDLSKAYDAQIAKARAMAGGAGRPRITLKDAAQAAAIEKELGMAPDHASRAAEAKKVEDERELTVPGYGIARDREEGKKLREGLATVTALRHNLSRAQELRENPKAFLPGSDANAELRALQGDTTIGYKTAAGLGVLSSADMELVHDAVGAMTSVHPGTSAQMAAASNLLQQGIDLKAKTSTTPLPGTPAPLTTARRIGE